MSASEKGTFKEPDQIKGPAQPKEPAQQREPREKFKESLQTKELRSLLYKFDCVYAHWKAQIKATIKGSINEVPLYNLKAAFQDLQELNKIYFAYQKVAIPTNYLRSKRNKCEKVTKDVVHAKVIQEEAVFNLAVDRLEEEALPCSSYGGSSPCKQQNEKEQEEAQQEGKKVFASSEFSKELTAAARANEEAVPSTELFAKEHEPAVQSLVENAPLVHYQHEPAVQRPVAEAPLVHLKVTGPALSCQMNTEAEIVKKPVKKAAKVKEPAAAKKSKKVTAKKLAAKKSPKRAKKPDVKKVAAKGLKVPKKARKSPKKPTGIQSKLRSRGNATNWQRKGKMPKGKERMNFKKHRKKGLPLKDSKVGGKNSRPPDLKVAK